MPGVPPRTLVLALALACLLAAGCLGGPSNSAPRDASEEDQSGGVLGINLVRGRDLGCSGGFLEGWADLVVRVRVDDRTVIASGSEGVEEPLFGVFEAVTPKPEGSRIEVSVTDDEGSDTQMVCDVGEGDETSAVFTWDGSSMSKTLRGDGPRAVQVELQFGKPPRLLTAVEVEGKTTGGADLVYTYDAEPQDVVAMVWPGAQDETVDGDARRVRVDGLCDGLRYDVRVVALAHPWAIGRNVGFELPNGPPPAPRILQASKSGERVNVEWEDPGHYDTDRFDIFLGPAGFSADAAHLRGTKDHPGIYWHESDSVPARAGDTHAIIRTVDTYGASTDSQPFAIGSPPREETTFGKDICETPGRALGFP